MQQKLYTILALLSCCSLLFFPGCNSDQSVDDQLVADAKDEQEEEKVVVTVEDGPVGGRIEPVAVDAVPVGVGVVAPVPVVEVVPPPPGPLPPPPPAPLIPHGDFGKHEHHGNKDEEKEPKPPKRHHPKCGDGKQEVLPDSKECKFRIYGSTNNTNDIDLYGFDENGEAKHVGDITGGLSKVYALDFDPQGQLFGLGVRSSDNHIVYFSLDCRTAVASNLADTLLPTNFAVTDMDFDSIGRLFVYVDDGGSSDQVGIINHVEGTPTFGQYIELGASGLDDELGNGLGSSPFPNDPLYHAGDTSGLTVISKSSGAAALPGKTIVFPSSVSSQSPFINSMDNDPSTNTMFVVFQDNTPAFFLATLNVNTGVIKFISEDHKKKKHEKAPTGLNTITVNRRYEECDFKATTPPLPPGTSCTDECLVIESDCDDGIDNDQNGLIDCQDPACLNQECNDHNGCNPDATCTADGNCTPVDPNFNPCVDLIHNECAVTTCHSVDDEAFYCSFVLDLNKTSFGSCTPDDNCGERNPDGSCSDVLSTCELGKCVQEEICPVDEESPAITCVGQSRSTIPVGICGGGPRAGDVCTDFNLGLDCRQCVGGSNANKSCFSTADCPGGLCESGPCVPQGTPSQPGCLDNNPCTADSCLEDQGCEYETLVDVLCDSGNACKTSECQIVDGKPACVELSNVLNGTPCDSGSQCIIGSCTDGVCNGGFVACGTPCTDFPPDCQASLSPELPATCDDAGHCIGFSFERGVNSTQCISGLCICSDGSFATTQGCPDNGFCDCACGPNSCGLCGPSDLGSVCNIPRTSGDCLINECNQGTCNSSAFCVNTTPQIGDCERCTPAACAEPLCTPEGCESTLLDGLVPCTVFLPNTGHCSGFFICENGVDQGICVGGTHNNLPCFDNNDCPNGTCEFPGTCIGSTNQGDQCFSNSQCPNGRCQLLTCLGGLNDGQGCTNDNSCQGGTCIQGCVVTERS